MPSADSLVAALDRLRCRAPADFRSVRCGRQKRTPSTRPVPPRSPPPLVCNGASVSVFIAQNGFRGPRKLYTSGRAQRAERHHHGRNIVTR